MISRLLHLANSDPPRDLRSEFYQIKERVLQKRGQSVGFDYQHIAGKQCFSCYGSGEHYEPFDCYKCHGTGWFKSPLWVHLEKFEFGKYKFHIPRERLYEEPKDFKPNIHGYIEHKDYGDKPTIAFIWLCILTFNLRLAGRWFNLDRYRVGFCHPFFLIQRACFLFREWKRRRCIGRKTCKACDNLSGENTFCAECDSEVPF